MHGSSTDVYQCNNLTFTRIRQNLKHTFICGLAGIELGIHYQNLETGRLRNGYPVFYFFFPASDDEYFDILQLGGD